MKRVAAICMLVAVGWIDPALAVEPGYPGDLSDRVASMDNASGSASAGLPLSNPYAFELSKPWQGAGTTFTNNPTDDGAGFDAGDLAIRLKDFAGATAFQTDFQLVSSEILSVDTSPSSAAGSHLPVKGDIAGAPGGADSGLLVVAPVPEADVWSMLFAGMGLIVLRMRNRSGAVRKINT